MALHFTRRLTVPLDPSSKARAFTTVKKQSQSEFDLLVSFHGNKVAKYQISAKKNTEEEKKQNFDLKQTYGVLDCHKQGVRGVYISSNDQVFATNSLDSVKVWSVDLFMYSQRNNLQI